MEKNVKKNVCVCNWAPLLYSRANVLTQHCKSTTLQLKFQQWYMTHAQNYLQESCGGHFAASSLPQLPAAPAMVSRARGHRTQWQGDYRHRSRMMLSWRISGRLGPEFTGKLPSGQCGDHLWGGEHAGAKRDFRQNTPSSILKQIMKVGPIKDTAHFTGNLAGKCNIQNRSTEAVGRRDCS